MSEYRGNAFADIAAALNDEKVHRDRIVLYRGQMEQIIRVHNEVIEAKNEVTSETFVLLARLKSVQPPIPTDPGATK